MSSPAGLVCGGEDLARAMGDTLDRLVCLLDGGCAHSCIAARSSSISAR